MDARFGLLANVVEAIKFPGFQEGNDSIAKALEKTVRKCINVHKESLSKLIRLRTGPKAARPSNVSVDFLESVYLGALLSSGAAQFLQPNSQADLVELGLACVSTVAVEGGISSTLQSVQERFVLEVLEELFADPDWASAVLVAQCARLTDVLRSFIRELGPATPGKGNLVQRLILRRAAAAGEVHRTVADLPFVKPFLASEEARRIWGSVVFGARRVVAKSAPARFYLSDQALGELVEPENAMRPDGVAMLPRAATDDVNTARRALVFASTCYSDCVHAVKVRDQFRSADFSRSYLSTADEIYKSAESQRKDWCTAGLHSSICVQVLVALPTGICELDSRHKITAVEGLTLDDGVFVGAEMIAGEPDVVVQLDMSNVHLLLGPKSDNADLYQLLALATRTEVSQWGG